MTDYVAHRRLALLLSPGPPLLAAGMALHSGGWRATGWVCLALGAVATALFLGNVFEYLALRRWRRRRCPACGSAFGVDNFQEVAMSASFDLHDDGACRHTMSYDLTCTSCGTRSRFDDDGHYLGPAGPMDDAPATSL